MGRWCHPTISSSVVPFSSRPQSFPASGSFKWVSSSHQVSFFEIASKYCISDSLVDYDGKRARRGGRVCPGRGSFKKKVPEVGKTQGVFFSRQRHLKLEKTLRKMTNIKKKGSTRVLVQFSHSVMSDSWQPHGLQHTRPPCPSPNPSAFSNSCPSRQWCHPTISSSFVPFCSCLQSFPASESFPNESVFHIRWPKYWSFSISPFNEYSGLISFRMDWLDLLAVQGTLESLLQHHSSKAPILQHSAFFMVHIWVLSVLKSFFPF